MSEPAVDGDDELLVAYLDHELPPDDVQRLEDRLTCQSGLRRRLAQLQSSWDMLGDLDDPPPSRDLVSSTMQMVVMELTSSMPVTSSSAVSPFSGGDMAETEVLDRTAIETQSILKSSWLRWISIVVVAIVAGSLLATWTQHRRERAAMEELYLAQHLDAFRANPDLSLIRQLAKRDDWQKLIDAMPANEAMTMEKTDLRLARLSNFDEVTSKWSDSDRGILASRFERVTRLKPEDLDRLKSVAAKFRVAEDHQSIIHHADAYARWREGLSVSEQLRLDEISLAAASTTNSTTESDMNSALNLSSAIKIDSAIKLDSSEDDFLTSTIRGSMQTLSKRSVTWLSDEATESIRGSLREIINLRLDQADPLVSKIYETSLSMDRWDDPLVPTLIRLFIPGPKWTSDQFSVDQNDEFQLTSRELDYLVDSLPDEAFAQLDRLSAGDPVSEEVVLRIWTEESIRRSLAVGEISSRDWYLKLSEEQRRRLNLLPPNEFYRELSERNSDQR